MKEEKHKTQKMVTMYINKDKAVPLQAWSDPEGSKKLWFPDLYGEVNSVKTQL